MLISFVYGVLFVLLISLSILMVHILIELISCNRSLQFLRDLNKKHLVVMATFIQIFFSQTLVLPTISHVIVIVNFS